MKNITLWIVIGAIALFVLGLFGGIVLPFGGNNFAFGYGCANGWNGYDMMGSYRGYMPMTLAPGASAGVSGWGMSPFGIFGMMFMWLIPLGVLALVGGGIFWIVRTMTQRQA
ncbi:hypothetical protein ANAEL_01872 [Anaerolineales bacterium]|nr:hypothetical protein ANAEL_01872 [Anaerolineales bacterium]